LIGGHSTIIDRPLAAAYVRSGVVAIRPIALSDHSDSVELSRGAEQPCIGNEDFLVSGALDLESPGGVADRGDLDEVIPFSAREGDRVTAVLVGAGTAIDVAGERGRGDFRVLEWFSLGAEHLASDHVQLLRLGRDGYYGCYDRGD